MKKFFGFVVCMITICGLTISLTGCTPTKTESKKDVKVEKKDGMEKKTTTETKTEEKKDSGSAPDAAKK